MAKDEIGHDTSPGKGSDTIEGPAGFCNFTPGGAREMPTCHAPASGGLANSKPGTDIEGPAYEGYPQLPTTKGKSSA